MSICGAAALGTQVALTQGHHAWVQTQGPGQQPRMHPASSWHHLVVWVVSAPSISSPTESHGEDFPSGKLSL